MRSTITRSLGAVTLGASLTLAPVGAAFATHVDGLPGDSTNNQPAGIEKWLLANEGIVAVCAKADKPSTPWTVPAQPAPNMVWVLAVVKAGSDQSTEYPNELFWYPKPGDKLSHSDKRTSHVIYCQTKRTPTTTSTTTSSTSTTGTSTSTTGTGTSTTGTGTSTTGTGTSTTGTGTSTTGTGTSTTSTGSSTSSTAVSTSTTGTRTTTRAATGPVVETDRPGGGDSGGQLGLLAGLGAMAAASGVLLNRRRRSAEH